MLKLRCVTLYLTLLSLLLPDALSSVFTDGSNMGMRIRTPSGVIVYILNYEKTDLEMIDNELDKQ